MELKINGQPGNFFQFVIEDQHQRYNLWVEFKNLLDRENSFYRIRERPNQTKLVTLDWVLLKWFKNYARRLGVNQVSENHIVKSMGLAFVEENPMEQGFPEEVPANPVQHQDYFEFSTNHRGRRINFYVNFEYQGDGDLFDFDVDGDEVVFAFDWVVLDLFKNFSRKIGLGRMADETVVKNLVMAWFEVD